MGPVATDCVLHRYSCIQLHACTAASLLGLHTFDSSCKIHEYYSVVVRRSCFEQKNRNQLTALPEKRNPHADHCSATFPGHDIKDAVRSPSRSTATIDPEPPISFNAILGEPKDRTRGSLPRASQPHTCSRHPSVPAAPPAAHGRSCWCVPPYSSHLHACPRVIAIYYGMCLRLAEVSHASPILSTLQRNFDNP